MLDTIIESSASLSSFVKEYRSAFKNKAQYGHFMAYILALLVYLGSKNLTGISKVVPGRRDESSVYRFLSEQDWDTQHVKHTCLGMLNRQAWWALQAIAKSAFARVKVKGVRYKTWSALGTLSSGHQVKILFNRRIGHKKWHFLVSTDLDLSPQTLLRFYLTRWEVENFYRAIKQNLGWGDYQMRNLLAIERHVLLVMVAYAFLELQRFDAAQRSSDPKVRFTLGSLQRSLRRSVQRATIQHVYELANAGFDLDTIYQRLAA